MVQEKHEDEAKSTYKTSWHCQFFKTSDTSWGSASIVDLTPPNG